MSQTFSEPIELTTEIPNWKVRRLLATPGFVEVTFLANNSAGISSLTFSSEAATLLGTQLLEAAEDE